MKNKISIILTLICLGVLSNPISSQAQWSALAKRILKGIAVGMVVDAAKSEIKTFFGEVSANNSSIQVRVVNNTYYSQHFDISWDGYNWQCYDLAPGYQLNFTSGPKGFLGFYSKRTDRSYVLGQSGTYYLSNH